MGLLQGPVKFVVLDDLVELWGRGQFHRGLCNPHIDLVVTLGTPLLEADLQLVHRRGLDKDGQGPVGVFLLDPQTAHHIDVKYHVLALRPQAFHFGFQGAVEIVPIDLLPFQKILLFDMSLKIRYGHKVVIDPVFFLPPARSGSGGYGKGQIEFGLFQKIFDNGGLPTAGGCRKNDEFASFHHSTLSICSLIFSSSSFICTTSCCMGAKLALDPMVLISLPISWAIKPNFFPLESLDFILLSK